MTFTNRLAARFREMPIRGKLRTVVILTTACALVLAGLAIVAADSILFYGYLRQDLSTIVRVIGDNSTGALAFDDAKAAGETLAALRARAHVQTACLYQNDGKVLATYARPDYKGACPKPESEQVRSTGGFLEASHRIYLTDRPLGSLVVLYDLDEIFQRVQIVGVTVLIALLLSSLITLALSSRLRALVAEPILELAGTANAVSQSRDYSIRARKFSQDEVGLLADALNQMMDGIQSRDGDLTKALDAQRDALDRLERLNSDLKRSNAELALSNSDLERFAFVASHDLQEPLRMIATYSQLLVAEYPKDRGGPRAEFVEQILGGTKRMRELLADLLSYTEIAGTFEQPQEAVNLNVVLERVTQTLNARITSAQAKVTADALPVLYAHEGRMTSLFMNLIGNAVKYRSEHPLRVHVSVSNGDGQLTFAVADNGIGIAPEYHAKIFTAFTRLHGREISGSGIGLAICQRIVERYGGRIWVESQFGAGSTFRFSLPKSMAELES